MVKDRYTQRDTSCTAVTWWTVAILSWLPLRCRWSESDHETLNGEQVAIYFSSLKPEAWSLKPEAWSLYAVSPHWRQSGTALCLAKFSNLWYDYGRAHPWIFKHWFQIDWAERESDGWHWTLMWAAREIPTWLSSRIWGCLRVLVLRKINWTKSWPTVSEVVHNCAWSVVCLPRYAKQILESLPCENLAQHPPSFLDSSLNSSRAFCLSSPSFSPTATPFLWAFMGFCFVVAYCTSSRWAWLGVAHVHDRQHQISFIFLLFFPGRLLAATSRLLLSFIFIVFSFILSIIFLQILCFLCACAQQHGGGSTCFFSSCFIRT